MGTFVEATAVERLGGRLAACLDPDWSIWGPFGGYLAAIALRAMGREGRHRRPATFSCQFIAAGSAGHVDIDVLTLKSGRRAQCRRATFSQGGKTIIEATAWFIADGLPGLEHDHAVMPVVETPDRIAPFSRRWHVDDEEARSPMWRHVERRPTMLRETSQRRPEWSCWLRLAEAFAADDPLLQAARALLWLDIAPWNTALMRHELPLAFVAPNLDLTAQFQPYLYAADAMTAEFLLVTVESPVAGAGLMGSDARLWSPSGKLVATGTAQLLCAPDPRRAVDTAGSREAGR